MSMFSKNIILLFILFSGSAVIGQNCGITISGKVMDEHTGYPLPGTNVIIEELNKGTFADSVGGIIFDNICPGTYHIRTSHIGCETERLYVELSQDTFVYLFMHHHDAILSEVVISAEKAKIGTQAQQSIDGKQLLENANKDLSTILERITGVSSIKNGSNISKPVIHGLFGNRVAILNNGIAQSGQQWGNDHAPEIDPMAAERISVIKGVGTLAYNGNSLGGIVLVEPGKIDNEPHLHGNFNYIFESNGRGNTGNLQLAQYSKLIAWKITGTLKYIGDRKTSDYYLNNTGTRESNLAIQLEKELHKNWNAELYYSAFNTTLGVLRGSHIGNLSDLEDALDRDVPFFTEDEFSYEIEAPNQVVNHHLLKAKLTHLLSESSALNFVYGGQLNKRKEYDVRRQNFEDRPALSLRQYSNYAEVNIKHRPAANKNYHVGIQLNFVDNENISETNIFPLIPDYISMDGGSFFTLDHTIGKWGYEAGIRYGYKYQSVATLTRTSPVNVKRYKNNFHNISFSGGLNYWINNHFKTTLNLGLTTRNPAINELYSNGLHQGVSGIEEGNTELSSETSLKTTLALEGDINQKVFFNSLIYYNRISDYIFLKPDEEVRLTIRGAFPVFKYTQTDASITGMDIMTYFEPLEGLNLTVKYSYIHARDNKDDLPLINIPSNTLDVSFGYEINKLSIFNNLLIEIRNEMVFRQDQAISALDFTPIPEGYNLLHAKISARREVKNKVISFYVRAENLFNKSYRNYLNRQRYFADDLGRNITFGINYKF